MYKALEEQLTEMGAAQTTTATTTTATTVTTTKATKPRRSFLICPRC